MPAHWDVPTRKRGRAGQQQRQRRLASHPLCENCLEHGLYKPTEEIDHIVPLSQGGTDTDDNIQGLCRDCHATKTAGEGGSNYAAANHPGWLRPSAIPLTILCGPPASGKTTYLREHATLTDVTIDLDSILLSIDPNYKHWASLSVGRGLLNQAVRTRNNLLGSLAGRRNGRAWFIVSAPTKAERDWWHDKLGGTLLLLHPGADECRRRALQRGTPLSLHGIDEWERKAALPWTPSGTHWIKGSDASGRPKDPSHPWNRIPQT